MDEDTSEYADIVTITYSPATEWGTVVDPTRWIEVEVGGGDATWDVGWLGRVADESLYTDGVPPYFRRETVVRKTSWGAAGAGIAITLFLAEAAFGKIAEAAAGRAVKLLSDRFGTPAVPVDPDLAIARALQRVAIRYEISVADLRMVERVDGTDRITAKFVHTSGTKYEIEVEPLSAASQTVRCVQTFE